MTALIHIKLSPYSLVAAGVIITACFAAVKCTSRVILRYCNTVEVANETLLYAVESSYNLLLHIMSCRLASSMCL